MKDISVTFTQIPGNENNSWTAVDHPTEASLCNEELTEYVGFPDDTEEFDAVFTVREPAGNDHFKLVGYSHRTNGPALDSKYTMGLMSGARELIGEMHEAGYRYLKVVT